MPTAKVDIHLSKRKKKAVGERFVWKMTLTEIFFESIM
jgi:hypothetical protein